MTTPATTGRSDTSLTRDLIHLLRYYLGNWRALLILATIVIVAGLVLNWSWLVAIGLAPILLSTLPCLVMCAVGVCVVCRSGDKRSAPVRDVAEVTTPPAALAVAVADNPSAGINQSIPTRDVAGARGSEMIDDAAADVASCCQRQASEAKSPRKPEM